MSVVKPQPSNNTVNQNLKQTHVADRKRGKTSAGATIRFGFSDWMTKWREILSQSLNVVMQKPCKSKLTAQLTTDISWPTRPATAYIILRERMKSTFP